MEKRCSECPEPRLAQSLCTFCNKWLCYQCTDLHLHQRPTATSHFPDLHQHPSPTTAGSPQCVDLHQGPGSTGPAEPGRHPSPPGPASCLRSLPTCPSHRQEPLELFCQSCDLLCCSSCHLSAHKNHRLLHVGKALQEQQWLFESLLAQVEEKRSKVENTAKQIEDRLHGVKITQRKAENQIKMAKMIMMNELNKRANLLIEQVEKISEDFQRRLEDQLQGAIETCGQLDHVQNFVTWATAHHRRNPLLFSRELISVQMQRLLEPLLHPDSWAPVKIKFNWDASYWTKQMSSLGQLTVEGGLRPYPEGVACPSILRPQPIPCMTLPTGCHGGGREQGCAYQSCCQPQLCCLHCVPPQPRLGKSQREASGPYMARCTAPAAPTSTSIHQPLQKSWGPESPPATRQCPLPLPSAPATTRDPPLLQISPGRGSPAHSPPALSQPPKPPKPQPQVEQLLSTQAKADGSRPSPGQRQPPGGQPALDHQGMTEESQAQTPGEELQTHVPVDGRVVLSEGQELERREPQFQSSPSGKPRARLQAEQQGPPRPQLPSLQPRDGRRSTSLEMSVTTQGEGADAETHSRPSFNSSSVCGRRKSRSQSIPPELAALSTNPTTDRPKGPAHSLATGAGERGLTVADQYGCLETRQRRVSDGVIRSVAGETSLTTATSMVQSMTRQSSLTSYKTEPDNVYCYANEDAPCEVKVSRQSQDKSEKDPGNLKLPVVCLERLKILVSRLPTKGRRQSDPLPASGVERNGTGPQQQGPCRADEGTEGASRGSGITRPTLSLTTPPYTESLVPSQPVSPMAIGHLRDHGKHSPPKQLPLLTASAYPNAIEQYSAADLDSDSEPRSVSETEPESEPDPGSYLQPESDPPPESLSEVELESMAEEESEAPVESEPCGELDAAGESELSVEYLAGPESDLGVESLSAEEVDADGESDESDVQPHSDSNFQPEPSPESDSDMQSDQAPESHGSTESGPELEMDPEEDTFDEPRPLRSDQEGESPPGPAQRAMLMANPGPLRGCEGEEEEEDKEEEEVVGEQLSGEGQVEMESEDFCAVCLIGGELLCCDRCPKVFHLSCHVPALLSFPTGDWVCTLCRDVLQPEVEYHCENQAMSGEQGLSPCDQRKCERLTLLIFSNMLSAPFHEPVSPLARHYYQIIKRPMDLSVIRAKLNKRSTRHYYLPEEFVADVCLMFRNCAKFNYPDSEVAQAGHSLEAFFSARLRAAYPGRAFPLLQDESDSDEYDEVHRTADGGFPWPERREQSHRKRKRRHSSNSRRHHV
ncbi:tripartite motif-containing protein 66 [Aplochiton taeniatus]